MMNTVSELTSRWLVPIRQQGGRAALFCLPCASGSSAMYRSWARADLDEVDVFAIELPGHGRRLHEEPLQSMDDVIDGLLAALHDRFQGRFGFFGHSMGGAIAFELAHALRARRLPGPRVVAVSAAHPPSHEAERRERAWDDAALIRRLRRLGGTPQEVLDHGQLMSLVLPAARADFQLVDAYRPPRRPPLDCPLVAFSGDDDQAVSADSMAEWRSETSAPFRHHVLPGQHFFLKDSEDAFLALLHGSVVSRLIG